jgi:hypothetical protein
METGDLMVDTQPSLDLNAAQRRIVRVLASAQILGGVGVASGIAMGALLIAELGASR